MATKRAAEIQHDEVVRFFGDDRIVDRIEFHDKPIDAHGTTGVWIWWLGRDKPSLVAVDKAMDVVDPDPWA